MCTHNFTNTYKIHTEDYLVASCDTRSIFKWSTSSLNSRFGCHSKIKESNLLYYISVNKGESDRFIPFSRELAESEMQKASSKILILLVCPILYVECVVIDSRISL